MRNLRCIVAAVALLAAAACEPTRHPAASDTEPRYDGGGYIGSGGSTAPKDSLGTQTDTTGKGGGYIGSGG